MPRDIGLFEFVKSIQGFEGIPAFLRSIRVKLESNPVFIAPDRAAANVYDLSGHQYRTAPIRTGHQQGKFFSQPGATVSQKRQPPLAQVEHRVALRRS